MESLSTPAEQLSNRRLMYETFTTAMRRVSTGHSDAHRVRGSTIYGKFNINDYYYFETTAAEGSSILEMAEKRREVLDSRRTLIAIDCPDAHLDGLVRSYGMAYPEDLRQDTGFAARAIRELVPEDWPPNEPFMYQAASNEATDGSWQPPTYHRIDEPFMEPDLAAIL